MPMAETNIGLAAAGRGTFGPPPDASSPISVETEVLEQGGKENEIEPVEVSTNDRRSETRMNSVKRAGKSRIPRQLERKTSPIVYILGGGKFGKFVVRALGRTTNPPPIALLSSHGGHLVHRWHNKGERAKFDETDSIIGHSGVDNNLTTRLSQFADDRHTIFDKLIVTTNDVNATVTALQAIKKQLLPRTTICFLNNRMGIIEVVNARVFPNPATRPRYMVGFRPQPWEASLKTKHDGTYLSLVPEEPVTTNKEDFEQTHELEDPLVRRMDYDRTASSPTFKSLLIQNNNESLEQIYRSGDPLIRRMRYGWNTSSRSLMRLLIQTPELNGRGFQYENLLQIQLERLATNSIISPLSVILDRPNGKLFSNLPMRHLMRDLLREIIEVVQNLPELNNAKRFKASFTLRRLESLIVQLAANTSDRTTSMLQDVRRGGRSNIDFINGYFVMRGKLLGISCPTNITVMNMVKAKEALTRHEQEADLPFHHV
jgi:2-dehydropantoate 2-reductase